MPSSRERSAEILQRALDSWGHYNYVMERYGLLHESLVAMETGLDVMNYLLGSLERFIQEDRVSLLDRHWGGIANATLEQSWEVELPGETMRRLHAIVGFYGVNRCFLFLYIHAYLYQVVGLNGPLKELDALINELDPH